VVSDGRSAQPRDAGTAPPDAPPEDAGTILEVPDAAAKLATPPDAAVAKSTPAPPDAAPVAKPPPDAAPPPVEKGFLVVSGDEALIGARVLVDGVFVGFVPNHHLVVGGRRRVEVVRADGTRLPAKEIDIDPLTHTRKRAAHLRW
jgi:hypothetical protein